MGNRVRAARLLGKRPKSALFDLGKDQGAPEEQLIGIVGIAGGGFGRKAAVQIVVKMQGHAHLAQLVLAFDPRRRFAGVLDRGQEQSDQDADDGDHNHQFQQGKAAIVAGILRVPAGPHRECAGYYFPPITCSSHG